ncbi:hypothetical protein RF11_10329 [Thelohanellus kitauei]|uniref:Uncharacterized protein n=1 Tax=Thelohanellus kitauei TaxID=669202 RepID=A0A0C2JVK3_THEKT|nr:hypothetical protein RF11_10329 [Thelohanellus kitauei]
MQTNFYVPRSTARMIVVQILANLHLSVISSGFDWLKSTPIKHVSLQFTDPSFKLEEVWMHIYQLDVHSTDASLFKEKNLRYRLKRALATCLTTFKLSRLISDEGYRSMAFISLSLDPGDRLNIGKLKIKWTESAPSATERFFEISRIKSSININLQIDENTGSYEEILDEKDSTVGFLRLLRSREVHGLTFFGNPGGIKAYIKPLFQVSEMFTEFSAIKLTLIDSNGIEQVSPGPISSVVKLSENRESDLSDTQTILYISKELLVHKLKIEIFSANGQMVSRTIYPLANGSRFGHPCHNGDFELHGFVLQVVEAETTVSVPPESFMFLKMDEKTSECKQGKNDLTLIDYSISDQVLLTVCLSNKSISEKLRFFTIGSCKQ